MDASTKQFDKLVANKSRLILGPLRLFTCGESKGLFLKNVMRFACKHNGDKEFHEIQALIKCMSKRSKNGERVSIGSECLPRPLAVLNRGDCHDSITL